MVEANLDDWALPTHKVLNLETGELLLLDWIICSASNLIPGVDLSCLVDDYHGLRVRIWQALGNAKNSTSELVMDVAEMREFMALVPTTFRWGTGPDVGYLLKTKLFKELSSGGAK